MQDAFFVDHVPVEINGCTYLVSRSGFCNIDKQVYKAILNGYPIETQAKTELTDDLLEDNVAYQ